MPVHICDCGLMVMTVASQATNPGSIPGNRKPPFEGSDDSYISQKVST